MSLVPFYDTVSGDCVSSESYILAHDKTMEVYAPSHVRRVRPDDLKFNPTAVSQRYTLETTTGRRVSITDPYLECQDGTSKRVVESPITPTLNLSVVESSDQLVTKVLNKIAGDKIDLGQHMIEYKETAGLMAGLTKGMYDGWKYLRKGRSRKSRRSLTTKDIAGVHLLNQFGLKPMFGDFLDAYTSLNTRLAAEPVRKTYRVKLITKSKYFPGNGVEQYGNVTQKITVTVEYAPSFYRDQTFEIGSMKSLLWEGTPFSFMVDAFLPVGDYLSSLDALDDITRWAGTESKKIDVSWIQNYSDSWGNTTMWDEVKPFAHFQSYERSVLTNLEPSLPSWRPSPSYSQLLNAVAILRVLRKT